ncbi:hypothetical protein DL93DRAFT_2102767 [Clavulina sp. PMI_390]|nr:hypothetical protein DL93DRAFT_2102767 [Clavulina sp. PMI_390]
MTSDEDFEFVYYQLFTESYALRSRYSFDSENESLGHIPRNRVSPPHTAVTLKRHIAHYEQWAHLLSLTEIWSDNLARDPMADDEYIPADHGAPGSSPEVPLIITIRNSGNIDQHGPIFSKDYMVVPPDFTGKSRPQDHIGRPSPIVHASPTPLTPAPSSEVEEQSSPFLLPSPILPLVTENASPHSPAVSVASPAVAPVGLPMNASEPTRAAPSAQPNASPTLLPTTPRRHHRTSSSRSGVAPWTIDETGFGEPTMHPKEAGRVMSQQKPPGWSPGEVRFLSFGAFMDKLGGNQLLSGTLLRNGMKFPHFE